MMLNSDLLMMRAGWFGLLLLMSVWTCAMADEPADQIERARLLRELLEAPLDPPSRHDLSSLPGARIGPAHAGAVRTQQFEDSQWRKLLGSQQSQIHAPSSQAIPESQWRSQTFDRDRRAEELSADILRRSREYLAK